MSRLLLIELTDAEEAVATANAASDAGYRPCEILSPHPLKGIRGTLAPSPQRAPVGWMMVGAASIGSAGGYAMQWFSAVIDYPIHSGGRPLHSWQAFVLVPFEAAIFSAAIAGILAWIVLSGLTQLHHPFFEVHAIERSSQDRYILVIPFSRELVIWARTRFSPVQLHEVKR